MKSRENLEIQVQVACFESLTGSYLSWNIVGVIQPSTEVIEIEYPLELLGKLV